MSTQWAPRWLMGGAMFATIGFGCGGPGVNERDTGTTSDPLGNHVRFQNPLGFHSTFSTRGKIDETGPFFQSLGTNGRRCVTCHEPSDGWTITSPNIQKRFEMSGGTDPLFATFDGTNCQNVFGGAQNPSLAQRRAGSSMLLTKGLIRIGIGIPANAELELVSVANGTYCNPDDSAELSMFRRPIPTTNMRPLNQLMWDGREIVLGQSIARDLHTQANDATRGHARSTRDLTAAERDDIEDFETKLFTAQIVDNAAGNLSVAGAEGGPVELARLSDGGPPGFTIYKEWSRRPAQEAARLSIARGEVVFNTFTFAITGVDPAIDTPNGHCSTCHSVSNFGNERPPAGQRHSILLNIGQSEPSNNAEGDLPLFTLRNRSTGQLVRTTDPGRALISGRWADLNKFKVPVLRDLAARAPYFHNGSAATLRDVVEFYDNRFNIFGAGEGQAEQDLVNFLGAL